MKFEWDKNKEQSNIKKHGVSFDEAKTLFYYENSIVFDDLEHSDEEDRELIVGLSDNLRVLIACYCERKSDVIRIISARKLSKAEIKAFKKENNL